MLLADLGRLNTDVVPLVLRIMEDSATAEEQYAFAERLAAMARRLQARAAGVGLVIDGEFATQGGADPGDYPVAQHQENSSLVEGDSCA